MYYTLTKIWLLKLREIALSVRIAPQKLFKKDIHKKTLNALILWNY